MCNGMRGKRSGVETQIRKENPSLLTISRDTVHMVSNAAKALLTPFQGYMEEFCSDVYNDIKKSPNRGKFLESFSPCFILRTRA